MQTISRVFLLIWVVLLVQDALPTFAKAMLVRPLNFEEVVEIIGDRLGMCKKNTRIEKSRKFLKLPLFYLKNRDFLVYKIKRVGISKKFCSTLTYYFNTYSAADDTTDKNDVVIDKIILEGDDQAPKLKIMPEPGDIIPRIVNNPVESGAGNPDPDYPPGTWREAAPVTTQTFVTLELSPETDLFGRPGDIVNVIFYLNNLGRDMYLRRKM